MQSILNTSFTSQYGHIEMALNLHAGSAAFNLHDNLFRLINIWRQHTIYTELHGSDKWT